MPQARKRQVSLSDTPYYHCVSRCVRRSFLCGEDKVSGRSFEHRRQWVEDRLLFLGTVFAIDICSYAVMSNHCHVVLHVDKSKAENWSDIEVLHRWHRLHKGTLLSQNFANKESRAQMSDAERLSVADTVKVYRARLYDLSWLMRQLNEYIAREANKEDDCTGRFWEGRFKSQALLDEAALAACMAYVDLNPIRAKMAATPESSKHTSICRRISDAKKGWQPSTLMPFIGHPRQRQSKGLPFELSDYIALVDMSGRALHPIKHCNIDSAASPILVRLGIDDSSWESLTHDFETHFPCAAGTERMLRLFQKNTGRKRMCGMTQSRKLLSTR